ncbi:Putative oxidoreductase GLYR1 [Triticum urartu]|uniref:Putative oxidoreductase GLYR1 n=1 Tax=Triticum urartu TaxID=4572 RepID=M8ADU2_TRIUA|nr:Putative oxidoreductase GLYR1 [Triticum urartu]
MEVVFDKDGVLEQIGEGKGYVDMSTVDAATSCKISEAVKQKGGAFVEAPVSGSKKPAEDGQLVILAAGDKVVLKYLPENRRAIKVSRVEISITIKLQSARRYGIDIALYDDMVPAFDVLGKKSFFLGEMGNGAKMKLVVNMIMGSMMNAFSEGLCLADKSGLSPQTLLDVLDLGAIANPMFKMKGPSMLQGSYNPAFPLKHQQKDMRLALSLGDENAVSMPVAAASNEAFKKARSLGLGDLDFSAVHEVLKGTGGQAKA